MTLTLPLHGAAATAPVALTARNRSQPRHVALSLQSVIQQPGTTGGRAQAQALLLEVGLDLRQRLGADQVAEIDPDLPVGLAHRLEVGVDVPHRHPGQATGFLRHPGYPR